MLDRPLATKPRRPLIRIGEGHYVLDVDDAITHVEASQVRRNKFGELRCDLEIRSALAGAERIDGTNVIALFEHFAMLNVKARDEAAGQIARRARTSTAQVDWRAILEELAVRVRSAEQTGEGAQTLSHVPRAQESVDYHVDHLPPFPQRHPMIWAAFGGTGKSILALHAAGRLQQTGIPCLFVDYELDAQDHRERLEGLFGAAELPAVSYVRATRPLVYETERLARIITERSIRYMLVDSIALASHAPLKDEESAVGYYRALRALGLGSLSIAHMPKPKDGERDDSSIFGSVFWFNLSRSVWHLKQAETTPDDTAIVVGMYHKKSNLRRAHQPMGIELRFESGQIDIRRADLADVASLAATLPLSTRIAHALRSGPLTVTALAEELEAKPNSVRKVVNRQSEGGGGRVVMFQRIPSTDSEDRIALAERRRA